MSAPEKISIDTRPSKAVVVDSLTRDISIQACIFDLIDNSIDAARNTMSRIQSGADSGALPESYQAYKICLNFSGDFFSISDNCGGIAAEHLKKSVLRFGERSAHNLGIGVFGVGLNRALFRIGKVTYLESDTGLERCVLSLDTDNYLQTEGWDLAAEKYSSTGKVGTSIKISSFSNETSQLMAGEDFEADLISEIGRRYGKFIDKQLIIEVNEQEVESQLVKLRVDGPYATDSKFFKVSEGISVYIECGQHSKHKFSAERGYDKASNSQLTGEYGWNIYCNERAVLISDKSWKTGWLTKFHTEFYGFVGHVSFICKDPSRLPWNTTKSDVDLNNSAYQAALKDMAKFALNWRKNSGDAKSKKKNHEVLEGQPQDLPGPDSAAPGVNAGAKPAPKPKPKPENPSGPIKKPTEKIDHNKFMTILPQDVDELHCNDKNLALVHEAKRLNLGEMTYSGLVLMRMLFESCSVCFLVRKEIYGELKEEVLNSRNQERAKQGRSKLSSKEEKGLEPSMDEIILFLQRRDDVWGEAQKNKIKHSLAKFSNYKSTLNSAAHNAFQLVNKYESFSIRDSVLPILRHLIEEG
ncbi:ATP-binding protein [Pseudomonas putida]|uniref:ATP-binding protein n=1 Tax=Pseudomonas putida TaxID=303 RepID=UPI0009A25270|nr:ATP-binding protein [Pseudomonas putida]